MSAEQSLYEKNSIIVSGARVHNLKNISVSIPRDKLVVITGLSGSGKSSLAFDTIYGGTTALCGKFIVICASVPGKNEQAGSGFYQGASAGNSH
jgi:ABC-type lipoprotein export system ATPase subunit